MEIKSRKKMNRSNSYSDITKKLAPMNNPTQKPKEFSNRIKEEKDNVKPTNPEEQLQYQFLLQTQMMNDNSKSRFTSNLESFLTCTTPTFENIEENTLSQLWEAFEEASAYGIEVPCQDTSDLFQVYFVPTLSNIQLTSTVTSNEMRWQETKKPHERSPLSNRIQELSTDHPLLMECDMSEISVESFFSVLWTPIMSLPDELSRSANSLGSFLVFQQFSCGKGLFSDGTDEIIKGTPTVQNVSCYNNTQLVPQFLNVVGFMPYGKRWTDETLCKAIDWKDRLQAMDKPVVKEVLKNLKQKMHHQMLDNKLENEDARWIYRLLM